MNLLFLTLVKIRSLEERGLYHDLMRKFAHEGHHVYIVSPVERFERKETRLDVNGNVSILSVKTLNLQKTNIFEKGIGTLTIQGQYLKEIKKYFSQIRFDIVLYSTPPITFSKVVSYIKKRDIALSYLLLKDIFPQNAVDLKMIWKNGFIHRYFLKKERELYNISDYIGCMSPANVEYLLKHNSYIDPKKVEVNPNSIEPIPFSLPSEAELTSMRLKYKIPYKSKVLVYGGNLGKPQGIQFLLDTIKMELENDEIYFLIVGSGTEYNYIKSWMDKVNPKNARLINSLSKSEYDILLKACDVGIILLHPDFEIPNFPSRLLSYLENGLPVLAATDENTDIGKVIETTGCGYWVKSGDIVRMQSAINKLLNLSDKSILEMRVNAYKLLEERYLVKYSYDKIIKKVSKNG